MSLVDFLTSRWGSFRKAGPERIFECPSCGKDKFYINVKKNMGHCFRCNYGVGMNLWTLLAKHEGVSVSAVKKMVYTGSGASPFTDFDNAEPEAEPRGPADLDWEDHFGDPLEPEHRVGSAVRRYLMRGRDNPLTRTLIREYDIRYGFKRAPAPWRKAAGRACVPVIEDGEVVYFVARGIEADSDPKYWNPPKGSTKKSSESCVFNLDRAANYETIIICEGVFDAISVGFDAVALFGKQVHQGQLERFSAKKIRRGIVLVDPDVSVEDKREMNTALEEVIEHLYWVDLRPGKDPGDMSRQEIEGALKRAEGRSEMDFLSKLEFDAAPRKRKGGQTGSVWDRQDRLLDMLKR
jgi:hypothetical protein